MKIEEFGVVLDDFLLWLKEKKGVENASFQYMLDNDTSDYLESYFIERTLSLILKEAEELKEKKIRLENRSGQIIHM